MPTPTPSFSNDLQILKDSGILFVNSIEEVRAAILGWKVSACAPWKNRVKVDCNTSLVAFISSTPGAVVDAKHDGKKYDLNLLLRQCYAVAFSMPPSTLVSVRSPRSRSASLCSVGSSDPPALLI